MNDKVRIGLIGLGRMGRIYVEALTSRIPRAELVAVADIDREAASKVAASHSIEYWFDNYQDLLKIEAIRGVVIAASTSVHTEIIVGAAEAGKDIFCEKPVALTLKETDIALKAVEKTKVKFQAGFMRRFDGGYMVAKKKIEEGKIGKPVSFKSISRDPMCPRLDYARVSGGLIMDMAIHDFDLARWLMESEVKRVCAEGGRLVFDQLREADDIDNATINMLFSNGSLGNVEVSRNALYGYDIRTEVLGSEGGIMIGYARHTPVVLLTKKGATYDFVPYIMERFGEAYINELNYFVDCIYNGQNPTVTGQDGRAALEIALAATQSYKEARPIEIPLANE
jgi:scyllo-inositol 2-dehydrogenase (NAD+)